MTEDAARMDPRTSSVPARTIISGGTSGIGSATALAFAEQGGRVGVISRSQESIDRALEGELAHVADRIVARRADVADPVSLEAAVTALVAELGGLDAIVASAGIDGEFGADVADITRASFTEVLDVNVTGAFELVRLALPALVASPNGSVTFVGSDSGFVAARGMHAYAASKGALVQLTRALALELFDDHGIRVNSVCPSVVDTPMARRGLGVDSFDDAPYPVNTAADVAWCIEFLASPRSRSINGVNLLSDFGYSSRSTFPA